MLAPRGQLGERFWANWLRARRGGRGRSARTREAARCTGWTSSASRHWPGRAGARAVGRPAQAARAGARDGVRARSWCCSTSPAPASTRRCSTPIVDKIAALQSQGTSFLIIEHNMDLVISLCRPVMVMAQGQLLMLGRRRMRCCATRACVEAYLGAHEPPGRPKAIRARAHPMHARSMCRGSRPATSPACRSCAAPRSRWPPARSSPCSAPTAPASPRW